MKRRRTFHRALAAGLFLLAGIFFSGPAWSFPGETTRVSVATGGGEGNGSSFNPSTSADGRFVAFSSSASNLVPSDSNQMYDVFVHDRETGETTRVSVATGGGEGNANSGLPSISADGRFVAFKSDATNLVSGDTNATSDVFVHDRLTVTTTRVSVATGGGEGNSDSHSSWISADGRFVAFYSYASNLVPGDNNSMWDVFVHDRLYGATTRVCVATGGGEGNSDSYSPSISADGRFVGFLSYASNLVPGDTNAISDVFVHDRLTGTTTRVSVATGGGEGNSYSGDPSISADGRYVGFWSFASNLVPGDTNATGDIFVHDRLTGTTTRVSVATGGGEGNGHSEIPSISADGRYVAFYSYASNLVPGDNNSMWDVFVHDRLYGATTRVWVATGGGMGITDSYGPSISAFGRIVAFESLASNLVPGDINSSYDVFVHEPEMADYGGELLNANFDAPLTAGSPPAPSPRGLPANDQLFSFPPGWGFVTTQLGTDNGSFGTNHVNILAPCCGGGIPGTGYLDAYPDTSTDNIVSGIVTVSWQSAARQTWIADDHIILYSASLEEIGIIRYGWLGVNVLYGGGGGPPLGQITPVATYSPYIAQNFSAVVDLDNRVFDLFIDGVREVTGAPFINPVSSFGFIRFGAGVMDNTANHSIDVDNIRMNRGGDTDGDGVADSADNCPAVYNPDQSDTDGDGLGDACENCLGAYNPDQLISFADFGDGNACNTDVDQDGIADKDSVTDGTFLPDGTPRAFYGILPVSDGGDNCPMKMNDQNDTDGDGVGNECDNCPSDSNPDQSDKDRDGYGDVCDPIETPSPGPGGTGGGGGTTVNCDASTDNDNICNSATEWDNCPSVSNPKSTTPWVDINGHTHSASGMPPEQVDYDLDGIGDACDSCPFLANPDKNNAKPVWYKDADADGWPDLLVASQAVCTRPVGYRPAGELHSILTTDCIDANASVYPGAVDPANDCNDDTPAVPPTYSIVFTTIGVNYDTWLPTGDLGSDNTVTISATVVNQNNDVQSVTPSLSKGLVTSIPGRYTNDPNQANVEEDYTYPTGAQMGLITVESRDFGGSITISGSATVLGVPVTGTFRLPKDSNNDGLPDAWKALYPGRELVPEGDIDQSVGNYYDGDGLTNFEEYRGFKWERLVAVDPAAVGPKYQTAAFVPEGTRGHFRTDPRRKDLFVAYTGYAPPDIAYPGNPNNTTFAVGAAFDNAGISVHATDNQYVESLGNWKIDVLPIRNILTSNYQGLDGRIGKVGTRDWTWDTKGMTDTRGWYASYGVNCTTGQDPLDKYFTDRPYYDRAPRADGKLNPPDQVDDTNDSGALGSGDTEIYKGGPEGGTRNYLDGDYFRPLTYNLQLSPVNIDNDQFVELDNVLSRNPDNLDYANSIDGNPGPKEYSKAQVIKHTITHELGHAVGIPHNSITGCLMSGTSKNWKRDGYFSSSTDSNGVYRDAKSWIFIHND